MGGGHEVVGDQKGKVDNWTWRSAKSQERDPGGERGDRGSLMQHSALAKIVLAVYRSD